MKIIPLSAFTDNYIWMLIDEQKQSAICVDPGQSQPVMNYLQQHHIALDSILLTHHHPDHIDGVSKLLEFSPETMVYAPNDNRISFFNYGVAEGDKIAKSNLQFTVLEIPGHTSSHICYFEPTAQLLFCGDTLFSAGCGRVFDGTYEELFASLQRLIQLPDETKVYCGHEYTLQNLRFSQHVEPNNLIVEYEMLKFEDPSYQCSLPSTIKLEKQINPFLRVNEPSISEYARSRDGKNTDPFLIFKQLRIDKNNFY